MSANESSTVIANQIRGARRGRRPVPSTVEFPEVVGSVPDVSIDRPEFLGGPGQLDRAEVELSESPAALGNDNSVWSMVEFLAWTALSSPTSVT